MRPPTHAGEAKRPAPLEQMVERYTAGLRDYLSGPGESTLEHAYNLGRQGISLQLGVLDMALVHGRAAGRILGAESSPEECRALQARTAEYFAECLGAFEIVHRGARESSVELRRLNEQLRERAEALIAANEQIERMSRARSAFLAEASRKLGASLDYEATPGVIAELAVPEFADWCMVELLEAGGALRRAAVQAAPELREHAERLKARRALLRDGDGLARVLQTGIPGLFPRVTDELLRELAGDEDGRSSLEALGCGSLIVLALAARGRILGAFTAGRSQPGSYGADDLALGEELARRASMALENAQLYRESQHAIRVRDDFLSVASHELKTPLTPLILQLQLAMRRLQRGALVEEHTVEVALRQVARLSELVDDLLDTSRISAGKIELRLERFPLAPLVRELLTAFQGAAPAHTIALTVELDPIVEADRPRLEQVLTNLVDNALKYSPAGGDVQVRISGSRDHTLLSVADRGIGIPVAQQEHLFERFFRADNARRAASGLGLGLYICRDIVERHGGRIWVESEEGRGSTFFVSLPIRAGHGGRDPAGDNEGARDG